MSEEMVTSRWQTGHATRAEPWNGEPQKCSTCVQITLDEDAAPPATKRLWWRSPGMPEQSLGVCDACASGLLAQMRHGRRVEVLEHGETEWEAGTVIKARKKWVRLDLNGHIADENSIREWRPLDEPDDTEAADRYWSEAGGGDKSPKGASETPREVFAALLEKFLKWGHEDYETTHDIGSGVLKMDSDLERAEWLARFDAAVQAAAPPAPPWFYDALLPVVEFEHEGHRFGVGNDGFLLENDGSGWRRHQRYDALGVASRLHLVRRIGGSEPPR